MCWLCEGINTVDSYARRATNESHEGLYKCDHGSMETIVGTEAWKGTWKACEGSGTPGNYMTIGLRMLGLMPWLC